jgi:nifR3 family TIM-barrel protein
MAFSWQNLDYPLVLCPPMDGITDKAYRELVAEMGGSDARYCEFINVKGLIYQNPKTIFELNYSEKQRPIIVQLFGSDPEEFYAAARLAVQMGFDAIDVNMGCPAHKVASKGGGCALMGNTPNAKRIIEMTIKGANDELADLKTKGDKRFENIDEIEITCKMRLGVDDKETVFTHGMEMIEAGAKAVAIHGRTLKQMYTGNADWEPIRKFKRLVDEKFKDQPNKPKVFGSGDVNNLYEAFVRLVATNVDGVMIGRGSFGNPWLFDKKITEVLKAKVKECRELIDYEALQGESLEVVEAMVKERFHDVASIFNEVPHTFEEISEMAIHHAELMFEDKSDSGIIQMRKHLAWYFHGFDGVKELRSSLVRVNSVEEIKQILANFKTSNSND